jgi:nucleoside-diphosphate-sugar epimerase
LSNKKLNEGSGLNPLSIYAKLKLNCEEAIIENTDPFFKYYIFRLGTVFGLSHRPRFDLVINLFAGLASSKKKIIVNGGNQWRPFVHVKDVSNAIIKAIKDKDKKNQKHIYNLISENCKIIDLGSKIKKIFKNAEIEVNQKEIDKRDYYVSDKKIQTKLKFKKKYSIEDGIIEIKNFIIKKKINIFNKKYHNFIFKK